MSKKWALFFSGRGSNMLSILKTQNQMDTALQPPFLVSNNPKALGITEAQKLGYKTHLFLSPFDYKDLDQKLKAESITDIFLLGYLKIIPADFLQNWEGRIFNLHPSLLPKYPGLHSIKKAYLENDDIGVSIHRVTEGVDEGEVLKQNCVLKAGSYKHLSLEEVETLVHSWEHKMVCEFYAKGVKGNETI